MQLSLETERLILKPLEEGDFANLLRLRSNPDVMRTVGNRAIQTETEVRRFLDIGLTYQAKHGFGFCTIFEKATGKFVGQGGLFHLGYDDTQSDIEIAYRMLPEYWGKGYATELVKALIVWGFEHLSVNKLVGATFPDNIASQKVLLKAGLVYCGVKTWYTGVDVHWFEIYRADGVVLEPYNKSWPMMAEEEMAMLIASSFGKNMIDIQHVGSTAIPEMVSKPIVDIQIAVDDLERVKPLAIDVLKSLGYQYWEENPDPTRLFFVKGMPPSGERRTHHVHIVEKTSLHWREKLAFRDYLRAHPSTAAAYQALKIELAKKYPHDREAYTELKSTFIRDVLNNIP